MLRNALGNADNKRDLGSQGFFDAGGGQRRPLTMDSSSVHRGRTPGRDAVLRDENSCGIGTCLLHGLTDIPKDRESEMLRARLLGVCTPNNLGACGGYLG